MEAENNTGTVKIDIHVSGTGKINYGEDKINCTVEDGEGKRLLQWSNEPETWIHQVTHKYETGDYNSRKTSPGVSIYQVPESIKKTKRGAYDPLVVFLGAYHHKKHKQLTAMDEYKLKAVNKTLERLGMTMADLYTEVAKLDKDIRDCYEDSAIEWDEKTLVWMMIMDACFILEFLRMELLNSSHVFHLERARNIKRREIMLDILKLENQIPLCILKKILELEMKNSTAVRVSLAKFLFRSDLRRYFQGFPFSTTSGEDDIARHIESGALHLLDLSRRVIADFLSNSGSDLMSDTPVNCCDCHGHCGACTCIATPTAVSCFRRTSWSLQHRPYPTNMIPSAEKLQRAGIKLQLSPQGKFEFKQRCFRRSTLFLPQIIVEDYTEIFLRNLMAFEECQNHHNSPMNREISRHIIIMDNLIDSKEDVRLFQRAKIITNYLGTEDEVAQIFNDLCFGITEISYSRKVLKNINDHYNSQINVWITELRKEHCSRPWYIVSFVAAALLLVMTLLQTIYTIQK